MTTPLVVVLQSDVSGLKSGLEDASGGFDLFGTKVSAGALAAGGAIAAGAAVAVSALAGWTQAAIDDAAEHERLMLAIANAGAATGDYTAVIDAAILAGQKRGYTDSQSREALVKLVAATGDTTTATALLATAQDVARFAGVDLQTAADAVTKAQNGQGKALAALTGQTTVGTTATDILANAQKLAAGQADLYAESTTGAMDSTKIAMDEATEAIGSAFIPIVEAIIPALVPVLEAVGELVRVLLPALKTVIGIVVSAFGLMTRAVRVVADAMDPLIAAIRNVIDWFERMIGLAQRAMDAARRAADAINPFSSRAGDGFDSGPALFGTASSFATAGPRAAPSGNVGAGTAGLTINVYGGDPWRLERAVRDGYRRWTGNDGTDAPRRVW